MDIDNNGQVVHHEICESVIQVKERMTYTNVSKILKGEDPELLTKYQDYVDTLKNGRALLNFKGKKKSKRRH